MLLNLFYYVVGLYVGDKISCGNLRYRDKSPIDPNWCITSKTRPALWNTWRRGCSEGPDFTDDYRPFTTNFIDPPVIGLVIIESARIIICTCLVLTDQYTVKIRWADMFEISSEVHIMGDGIAISLATSEVQSGSVDEAKAEW